MLRFLILLLLGPGAPSGDCPASSPDPAHDRVAKEVWLRILRESPSPPAQAGALLEKWLDDPEIRRTFESPEVVDRLAGECTPAQRQGLEGGRAQVNRESARNQSRLARSANAASSNPSRVGLVERSGIIDVVALAVEGTNFVSADNTAVTLNLNAAGLLRTRDDTVRYTPTYEYTHRNWLNRLGGTVTFGAKIPEKEITGFSGFPRADELFDALSWDVKLRLVGDRDPRAARWQPLLLGRLGYAMGEASSLAGLPETPDDLRPSLAQALRDEIAPLASQKALRAIRSSLQVSLKLSGLHLTEQKGMNKYAGTLLLDKGFGAVDGTLNASFSATQDVTADGLRFFTLKQWNLTGALSGTVLQDALVTGRGSEVTLSAEALIPSDGDDVPLTRKTLWRADLALTLPVSPTAQIPVSITFTNDPNNLSKSRYVQGRIGVNYDFGSLKKLLGSK
jgi:hypothetical protein